MRRLLMNSLIAWKKNKKKFPILVRGAKKTGKTWLLNEFGRTQFAQTAYISCGSNVNIERLFSGDLSVPRIISGLQAESMCTITPENTLIIFDDISENPKAMEILHFFCNKASEYYVVAACSIPTSCAENHAFLEDARIRVLKLYPMSFDEFMEANGSQTLCASLKMHDFGMIRTFRSKLIDFLRVYLYVGGMPEAVQKYIDTKDLLATRAVQRNILCEIERDFVALA